MLVFDLQLVFVFKDRNEDDDPFILFLRYAILALWYLRELKYKATDLNFFILPYFLFDEIEEISDLYFLGFSLLEIFGPKLASKILSMILADFIRKKLPFEIHQHQLFQYYIYIFNLRNSILCLIKEDAWFHRISRLFYLSSNIII